MRIKTTLAMLAVPILAVVAFVASAQSPVGRWKTYDEDTGKPRLIVEVYETKNGSFAAKVLETLFAPNATCTECKGENKNKPIKGMVIMWNQKPTGDGSFEGGTVLKLANGKSYKSKAKLLDGGRKFEVSGCVGPICKAQTWTHEN